MSRLALQPRIKVTNSFNPAAQNADPQGSDTTGWVDLQNFNSAVVLLSAGLWTDGAFILIVEESDDAGVADAPTTVAAADLDGTLPTIDDATNDNTDYTVGYLGVKRFIRPNATESGSTTGLVLGGSVIAGNPEQTPV